MILVVLLALVVFWILGDLIYSRVVAGHLRAWEATIERDADGVRVGCREYTVGSGDTALLLIHGFNDSPHAYYKMAPRLAERGYTCRVMRLPGFAEPIDQYAATGIENWFNAVDREIKVLREKHDHVGIVAHSLGGAVTIAYLIDHPETVGKVVLLSPALAVSNRRSPVLSTRAWHEIARRLLFFTRITETPFPNDAHDPAEQEYSLRTPFSPRHVFDETFRLLDMNKDRAKDFCVPLWMAISQDDQVVDWQAAERFFQGTASPTKTIHYAKDAGHAITVDHGWQALTTTIADFFSDP